MTETSTAAAADCIEAAARCLASEPDAVDRALRVHQADDHGGCAGCAGRVRWPCVVAFSAEHARARLRAVRA